MLTVVEEGVLGQTNLIFRFFEIEIKISQQKIRNYFFNSEWINKSQLMRRKSDKK